MIGHYTTGLHAILTSQSLKTHRVVADAGRNLLPLSGRLFGAFGLSTVVHALVRFVFVRSELDRVPAALRADVVLDLESRPAALTGVRCRSAARCRSVAGPQSRERQQSIDRCFPIHTGSLRREGLENVGFRFAVPVGQLSLRAALRSRCPRPRPRGGSRRPSPDRNSPDSPRSGR